MKRATAVMGPQESFEAYFQYLLKEADTPRQTVPVGTVYRFTAWRYLYAIVTDAHLWVCRPAGADAAGNLLDSAGQGTTYGWRFPLSSPLMTWLPQIASAA